MPETQFVFVLGTGRCGSTLVHEIMARHRDAGFVSNVDDNLPGRDLAGRWNRAFYRRTPVRATTKGRLRYAPSEAYRLLDAQVSPLISAPCRDLTADDVTPWLERRFRQFFERRAASQRSPVFVHKFTGWPRAEFISRILPEARFVHVIRDGRAVANSWVQMPWWEGHRGPSQWHWGPLPDGYAAEWDASGRSFVLLAGLAWKVLIDAFDAARDRVPNDRWLDVRYEDVVAAPRESMKAVLDFSGMEWNAQFDATLGRYRFATGRTDAFRSDLDERSIQQLDRSLQAHLTRHGYSVT